LDATVKVERRKEKKQKRMQTAEFRQGTKKDNEGKKALQKAPASQE